MEHNMTDEGYVYVVESNLGTHKIGQSVDPEGRLLCLQRQRPLQKLRILYAIPTSHMSRLEIALHTRYAARRIVRGAEWFVLTDDDLCEIAAMSAIEEGE